MSVDKSLASCACAIVMSLCVCDSSRALQPAGGPFPVLSFDVTGTTSYDAATDVFSVGALPIDMVFEFGGPPRIVDPTGGPPSEFVVMDIRVDETGDGSVDYDGVLLTGEVTAFAFEDNPADGSTDFFDLDFVVTGGSLAPLYAGLAARASITSTSSSFAGDFSVSFGGGAEGTLGPVLLPACCFPGGGCSPLRPSACTAAGGVSKPGLCSDVPCEQAGACCLGPAGCVFGFVEDCLLPSGIFLGEGTACDAGACDDLVGCADFADDVIYATGTTPLSVAMGDLDNDGDLDLATANAFSANVSVLLNDGDGVFAAQVTYGAGDRPRAVAVGDLDGDGDLDLAVANTEDDNASVLLNNGGGTFATHVTYGTGASPASVATGDLDGDGDLDLAVGNFSDDNASVLLNNGDGTFATDVTYATGARPISVSVGDLNGDGDLDLAVTNRDDNNVSVLLNNGDGTFAPQLTYGVGATPFRMAIGDLDGNGDLDLAVANRDDDNVSVLLNNGDGTFATQTTFAVGNVPSFVAVGDLDGDGDLDLAVPNSSDDNTSVLLNNGDGTLAAQVTFGVGNFPHSAAVGDLDGNGQLDLAVANTGDNVSVLLQDCRACCLPAGACEFVSEVTCMAQGGISLVGMCSEVTCPADIALAKTVDVAMPEELTEVVYTITATNNGPNNSTGFTVGDVPPAGVTYLGIEAGSDGTYNGVTGAWNVGALNDGATATLMLRVVVNSGTAASTINNTATIIATNEPDDDAANDVADVDIMPQAVAPPPATGACCLAAGGCTEGLTQANCEAGGGIYRGDDVPCDSICDTPASACCLADGSCNALSGANCLAAGGTLQPGVSCGQAACPQPPSTGACCMTEVCDVVAREECLTTNGVFIGVGTNCSPSACDFGTNSAACCLDGGGCEVLLPSSCLAMSGTPQDLGTSCSAPICPATTTGACCLAGADCQEISVLECNTMGGLYQGNGLLCVDVTCPAVPDRATSTDKGSLLVLSAIELRFGGIGPGGPGAVLQDTFISLTNDYPEDVKVQMYYVNGDPPLAADPASGERAHPGWNYIDNAFTLTGDQPTYWSALTGLPAVGGVAPFTALDPGFPPGRPANDGTGERVLRGFLVLWAVNDANQEIRWNHLKAEATVVNYLRGCAWEYGSVNYPVVDPAVAHGAPTGTPGVLNLNGIEYAQSFAQLLMNFQAPGAAAFSGPRQVVSDTWLALHPVSADLRQEGDGPVTTKANFSVWNMNEVKFSETHRCITCWDGTLLSQYEIPNNFVLEHLQTPHGKARLDGLASQVCDVDVLFDDGACGNHPNDVCSIDAPLQGVITRLLTYDGGMDHGAAAANLVGLGLDPTATIQYDVLAPPPEGVIPSTPRELLDWLERQLRTQ
ncbi:MAG: DUF11 domain-containing protein [Planctomycetes bacterium]|nr:DUF11 domain-containing protein [Planctomycetota bacterium]